MITTAYTAGVRARFVDAFEFARIHRHMPLNQVAIAADLPLETIYRWARGEVSPPLEALVLLADILECSLDELCGHSTPAKGGAT